jgi:hypothetical protein
VVSCQLPVVSCRGSVARSRRLYYFVHLFSWRRLVLRRPEIEHANDREKLYARVTQLTTDH